MVGLDTESLSLAGAFVVGTVVGTVATIRLTRALIEAAVRARRRLDDDDTRP